MSCSYVSVSGKELSRHVAVVVGGPKIDGDIALRTRESRANEQQDESEKYPLQECAAEFRLNVAPTILNVIGPTSFFR